MATKNSKAAADPNAKKYTSKQMAEFKIQFLAFDKDKDGLITAEELNTVFKSINQVYTEEEITDMITDIDQDGDGKINLQEFIVYMESTKSK